MSINRVVVSGNLTRDPELRVTPGGTQVLGFGVAVNDRRRNQQTGEWEDYPNFIDCTMFGNRAEALSRMKPEYIGLLTLLFELPTPLMRDWQEGRFYLMNPIEIAHETLILLEHIDSEGSIFRANHASNYVNLAGTLNRDRDAMCQRLRQALEGKVKFRSEAFRAR